MIVSGIMSLAGQLIGLVGAKGKAAQEQINTRVSAMERSWTDEVLVAYWFSPGFVAWFSPEAVEAWTKATVGNEQLFTIQLLITAAVFGLGKIKRSK